MNEDVMTEQGQAKSPVTSLAGYAYDSS